MFILIWFWLVGVRLTSLVMWRVCCTFQLNQVCYVRRHLPCLMWRFLNIKVGIDNNNLVQAALALQHTT